MENNNMDYLLLSASNMLKNQDIDGSLSTICMSKSLEILNQRIIDADCSSVLQQDISKEEYEQHFEELLTELDLVNLIAEIKYSFKNIGENNDN